MRLKIEENETRLGFHTYFTHGQRKYYADLSEVRGVGAECMIFKVKRNGEIDWNEVYCKRDIPITEEQITACVEEFKNDD